MGRSNRAWIAPEYGAYHLISRVAGALMLLEEDEKRYFLKLLERFARGFYVDLHSFCIMSNHFHLLASGGEQEAEDASNEELEYRYKLIFGKDKDMPCGSVDSFGEVEYDEDGHVIGIEGVKPAVVEDLRKINGVGKALAIQLAEAGFTSFESVATADLDDLIKSIDGIGIGNVEDIQESAQLFVAAPASAS